MPSTPRLIRSISSGQRIIDDFHAVQPELFALRFVIEIRTYLPNPLNALRRDVISIWIFEIFFLTLWRISGDIEILYESLCKS